VNGPAASSSPPLRLADLADARVAIWGFGREGRATLAALRRYFPRKDLTLFCSDAEAAALRDGALDAHLELATSAPEAAALERFDVVVKSPGISPYKLPAAAALRAGVRFTSGSALWFAEHPHARTICVTGTKGKSTVATLVAHLLRKGGHRIALAGNVGMPLLELIAPPSAPEAWVIELSSFQTHDFGGAPTVAVVNNLYEEHLDWHGTRERYVEDKLAIAARARTLVVNAQPELLARTRAHPRRRTFGDEGGWHVSGGKILRGRDAVLDTAALALAGPHNALNVCAALAAVDAAGFDAAALASHAATFAPLPHRLQRLGEKGGVAWINDCIATTPYATVEAVRSLPERAVTVLVGGFDRGVDWAPFVAHVAAHAPHAIVTMGANGAAIAAALKSVAAPRFALAQSASLAAAVEQARALTPAGGAILLSPGAPSFDAFRDYAERGREFARLAGFDPSAIAQIEGLGIA
jgi:UDP-N-acetylmuramoylalanine--D-glutamate ligase